MLPKGDVPVDGGRIAAIAVAPVWPQHHVRRHHPVNAGIPRQVFLESINKSVLGSMYTR